MITVISEDQLGATNVRDYHDVLAVRPGERNGVEVYAARFLAPLVSSDRPAPVSEQRVLLIEVEDPQDQLVIDRLRYACTQAWTGRRS